MFTGVGGFEYGIEKAFENIRSESSIQGGWNEDIRSTQDLQPRGNFTCIEKPSFECVGYSEIDKYANQVMRHHYPELKNYGDVTKINPNELPDFDLLCGGVPCQSWSIAGKRKGFEDVRGTMWFEVFRIANIKKPKYLLLENVKGLLSHNDGKSFERICELICEMGYVVDFTVLNSKYFGVPQNRERVFILAIREELLDKSQVI
jgi:DNA (cytosine-5)-methyltransferase 1